MGGAHDECLILGDAHEEVDGLPILGGAHDEVDGMPNEHFLYSLKDFQPFESNTYRGKLDCIGQKRLPMISNALMTIGIVGETRQWVTPFVSNVKLQTAFLAYTKLPSAYEKLNELSVYVRVSSV